MPGIFAKDRIVAPADFNRWKVPPASIAIHLCIGSVDAWSNFNPALVKVRGVVAPAPGDWSLGEVVWVFTVAIVFLGLAASFAGKWLENVGPRVVGTIAAACWGGGFLIGSLGIWLHPRATADSMEHRRSSRPLGHHIAQRTLVKAGSPRLGSPSRSGSISTNIRRFTRTVGVLVANKTVSLSRLMSIAPPGTMNPSATLYNSTMYLMALLLAVAFAANNFVRPVHPKHHLEE